MRFGGRQQQFFREVQCEWRFARPLGIGDRSGQSLSPLRRIGAAEMQCQGGTVIGQVVSLVLPFGITVTYFGQPSGGGSQPFVFKFGEESSQVFASEGPLKGRGRFLVSPLKG